MFRKIATFAAGLLLIAAPTFATTFTVKSTAASGATSMKSVMDSVQYGDTVYVNHGTYPIAPKPSSPGTIDASKRTFIIGDPDAPDAVVAPGIKCSGAGLQDDGISNVSYTTWRGFKFIGDMDLRGIGTTNTTFSPVYGDSVVLCNITGGVSLDKSAYSGFDYCQIGYGATAADRSVGIEWGSLGHLNVSSTLAFQPNIYDFITHCTLNLFGDTDAHEASPIRMYGWMYGTGSAVDDTVFRAAILYPTFSYNRGTSTLIGTNTNHDGTPDCWSLYDVRGGTFTDNYINHVNATTGCPDCALHGFYFRDYSDSNYFARDTLIATGPLDMAMGADGGNIGCLYNTWDNCWWYGAAVGEGAIHVTYDCAYSTYSFCRFILKPGTRAQLKAEALSGPVEFRNCTFVAKESGEGPIKIERANYSGFDIKFHSCIFYNPSGVYSAFAFWPFGNNPYSFDMDYNDYESQCCGRQPNATNVLEYPQRWNATSEFAGYNSFEAPPYFTNDSNDLTFNEALTGAGLTKLVGHGEYGTTVGAWQPSVRPATPHIAWQNYATTDLGITWVDVGSDSLTGQATIYDIRYIRSTNHLTEDNWTSALPIPGTDVLIPAPAGTTRSYMFPYSWWSIDPYVSGFIVAMKVRNSVGNWSAISNYLVYQR